MRQWSHRGQHICHMIRKMKCQEGNSDFLVFHTTICYTKSFHHKYSWFLLLYCGGAPPTGPLPASTDENKSTKTWPAWGGKVADLSKEKGQEPFPQWAFIGFNLHRNIGKAHQSLSGSKDQTIDNKELWGLILSQGQLAKGL